jgi:histidine ammonia-lyase
MRQIKFLALFQESKTILFIGLLCSSQACDLRLPGESIDAVRASSKALYRGAHTAYYSALMTAH